MFIFQFYSYICSAVRGARPTEQAREGVAEMIPSEPDMYNDSAGKRSRGTRGRVSQGTNRRKSLQGKIKCVAVFPIAVGMRIFLFATHTIT